MDMGVEQDLCHWKPGCFRAQKPENRCRASPQRAKAAQDMLHRKKHTEAIYTKPGKPSDSRMYKRCLGPLASRFVDVLSKCETPRAPEPPWNPRAGFLVCSAWNASLLCSAASGVSSCRALSTSMPGFVKASI